MKLFKIIPFFIFFSVVFFNCDNGDNKNQATSYPSLKIVNQLSTNGRVTSVSLVGYTFNSLSIQKDESQTFALDKGMPAGNNNINVEVGYYSGTAFSTNNKFNFKNGETRTITIKGGSNTAYLE